MFSSKFRTLQWSILTQFMSTLCTPHFLFNSTLTTQFTGDEELSASELALKVWEYLCQAEVRLKYKPCPLPLFSVCLIFLSDFTSYKSRPLSQPFSFHTSTLQVGLPQALVRRKVSFWINHGLLKERRHQPTCQPMQQQAGGAGQLQG